MIYYCEKCDEEVSTKVIAKKEALKIYGEEIVIDTQCLICEKCGEDVFCEELDNKTLVTAYNEYRKRHKLLLPEEIKKIREQYGLSQRSFAKLLNWGDKTICRYENGAIQDCAHNSLLLFLREPENMRTYLTENEVPFTQKQIDKLLNIVDKLENNNLEKVGNMFFDIYFSKTPCLDNGFKGFDYEKFCAMVLYFANNCKELLKTKLMKLLNYSDMIFFKENGVSISGLKYVHLPYGPVPENFDMLIGRMTVEHVCHITVSYDSGFEKHQVIAESCFPGGVLSKEEINVLERINNKFKDYGSAEISNYSHYEKGYKETKQGQIISCAFAKDIC